VCALSVYDSVHLIFYVNADTCVLGFRHLSAPASEGGLVLGRSTGDMARQYLSFGALQSVLVVGWGGLFQCHGGGERGCYRCTWVFFIY
jgi:hypothetical protein